jgi:hypothetical protein
MFLAWRLRRGVIAGVLGIKTEAVLVGVALAGLWWPCRSADVRAHGIFSAC